MYMILLWTVRYSGADTLLTYIQIHASYRYIDALTSTLCLTLPFSNSDSGCYSEMAQC